MDALATLRAEVQGDPLGRGYASMNPGQVCASLNAVDRVVARAVPITEVSSYCVRQGIIGAIKAALDATSTAADVRGLCHATLSLIERDYRLSQMDVSDPAFGQVTGGLIAAGLLTADQRDALLAMGSQAVSRAAELGLPEVGPGLLYSAGVSP